jgi:RNA polymerase sigma factor (sigma-70 family)
MSGPPTPRFQDLLDRLTQGNESARTELVGWAYERLRRLARKVLRREFPRLEQAHASASIANRAVLRLLRALERVRPATERDFFNLAARNIRWVLLSLARQKHPASLFAMPESASAQDSTADDPPSPAPGPSDLEPWAEFHRQVGKLPKAEREVFELIWYGSLTQAEVARITGLHAKEVSRRWLQARMKLADAARDIETLSLLS